MPKLSRWFIKAGIFYFVLSLVLAVAIKAQANFQFWDVLNFAEPVFYHTLMVGWITQIIFGVSIWMFPRLTRERPRGSELLGWVSFSCLNSGLLLRVFSEPQVIVNAVNFWTIAILFSAILQWIAGVLYVVIIWGRVKAR